MFCYIQIIVSIVRVINDFRSVLELRYAYYNNSCYFIVDVNGYC